MLISSFSDVSYFIDCFRRNHYTCAMRGFLAFVLVLLCPAIVLSHPGKTDKKGGHRCWKGCAEWQLDYGEYHLHDKYFKPIRLEKIATVEPVSEPSRPVEAKAPEKGADAVSSEQPGEISGAILPAGSPETKRTFPEGSIVSLIEWDLVIFALALLLCAAFFLMRRRRRRGAVR
jgi:hypothetical protein